MKILDKILGGVFPTGVRLLIDDNQVDNEIENVIRGVGLTPEGEKSLTGTASSSTTTITGVGTLFLTQLRVGDLFFETSNPNVARRIVSITSNLVLTIESAFPAEFSAVACSIFNVTQLIEAINLKTGKYFIDGFVPSSGATPDEQVNITKGIAICEDGLTMVKLVSDEADIDFPTLNGGALANSTTYHLFRFLKDDDTYQWWLDTSLTPTITNIKSALAYRRIDSYKTDSSGDLPQFFSIDSRGGLIKRYYIWINEYSSAPTTTQTLTTCLIPLGLKLLVKFGVNVVATGTIQAQYRLYSPDVQDVAVTSSNSTFANGNAAQASDNGSQVEVLSNISGQIAHRANSATGTLRINNVGYTDFRNYY